MGIRFYLNSYIVKILFSKVWLTEGFVLHFTNNKNSSKNLHLNMQYEGLCIYFNGF